MHVSERKLIEEERFKFKRERKTLLSEKLSMEEGVNEIRRERESLEIERKNFDNDKNK